MINLGIAASFAAISIIPATTLEPLLIVKAENLSRDPEWAYVYFSVVNNANTVAEVVIVDCTFYSKDSEPLETIIGTVSNVKPGNKAIGRLRARYTVDMKTVLCTLNEVLDQ